MLVDSLKKLEQEVIERLKCNPDLCIVIFGATASGKSFIAEFLAQIIENNSPLRKVILINADSTQIYKNFEVLTAVPSIQSKERYLHLLYSHHDITSMRERYSVHTWLHEVNSVSLASKNTAKSFINRDIVINGDINNDANNSNTIRTKTTNIAERNCQNNIKNNDGYVQQVPIVIGGTGLYLYAFLYGIDEIPSVPREFSDSFLLKDLSHNEISTMYNELCFHDNTTSARIFPKDSARVLRAYIFYRYTGRMLWEFYCTSHRSTSQPKQQIAKKILTIDVQLQREVLYKRIEARLEHMIVSGAIEEVELLLRALSGAQRIGYISDICLRKVELCNLIDDLPKIIGLRELVHYLTNIYSLEEAKRQILLRTRHYAKRQLTWFRNKHSADIICNVEV